MPQPRLLPFVCVPDFLGAEARQALLAWTLASLPDFAATAFHYADDGAMRRVSTGTRDLGPSRGTVKAHLRGALPTILAGLGMKPFEHRLELELVAHGDGALFTRHIDAGLIAGQPRVDRRVSAVYYFHREPKGFTGGALRFHSVPLGRTHDVEPAQDLLVAFPSFSPHEVCPVSCPSGAGADSRFAVNIWLHAIPREARFPDQSDAAEKGLSHRDFV